MNTNEACNILGVQIGASESDVSKAFKSKAVECHPDRNGGSKEAEEKFKKINEAYQFLQKHGTNQPAFNDIKSAFYDPSEDFAQEMARKMHDMFNNAPNFGFGFGSNNINITVIDAFITFEESVLGCRKDITYTRTCKGDSDKSPCPKCNGTGKRKYGVGAVKPADDRELPCNGCVGTGFVIGSVTQLKQVKETVSVRIPSGVESGVRITLKGKGNYVINGYYSDLAINIKVLPSDKGLTMVNGDVISTIDLTLLEALKGTKKSVWTIKGEKVLEFKSKVRNGDRIRVAGFGAPPNGAQVIIVNVSYPDDVSEIINMLEKEQSKDPAHSEF
jgi:molecular chaperone DnaJ